GPGRARGGAPGTREARGRRREAAPVPGDEGRSPRGHPEATQDGVLVPLRAVAAGSPRRVAGADPPRSATRGRGRGGAEPRGGAGGARPLPRRLCLLGPGVVAVRAQAVGRAAPGVSLTCVG